MARHVVGTVDELPPGSRKIVELEDRSVGVFNINGEYFALLNRCPHQAGPLCKGNVHGFLPPGDVGEYRYSRPGEILRCPWHGWEFDIRTGQSWFDPKQVRVRRYEVTVAPRSALAGESVAGDLAPSPPAVPGTTPAEVAEATARGDRGTESEPGMEGLEKGPYVAETFPVVVEHQYVIVQIGR